MADVFLKSPHWTFLNCVHSLIKDREEKAEISTKSTPYLQQFSFNGLSHYFYFWTSPWCSDPPRIMPAMQTKDKDK